MDKSFSIIRQSLIEWYPVNEKDKTLLINKGDSTLDELLGKKSQLTTVDDYDSLKKADTDYDIILLYDLYGFCIENDVAVKDMIATVSEHRGDNGTILLAMENKLGMRYFAGCDEEQKGGFFTGIEDYSSWECTIRPLSKHEVEDILRELKLCNYKFYYPYPDYKYPTIIYSDECLPKEGELSRNIRNLDKDRYVMFDERRAFDSVIKAGLFKEFSNSYLVVIN